MPISFNKTFTKSKEQSHFYVFEILFLEWDEAFKFCEENKISFDFIVKTKYYINH
jgi:hypothetical protein